MTIAFTIFFSVQLLIPNKSEAQITCSTDFYGNTRCVDNQSGNSSTTRTDFYGNDNNCIMVDTVVTSGRSSGGKKTID